MSKWYGTVGFIETVKSENPGVCVESEIVKKKYYGNIIRNSRRTQSSENLNDDLTISNEISIIADPYAYQNFFNIRYVTWMGTKWKVTNVDVKYPRLNLSIGGVYNGPGSEES